MMTLVTDLVGETFRNPRAAARRLIAFGPPIEARWIGLALVSVLAVLETRLAILAMPLSQPSPIFFIVSDPWTGVPVQFLSLLLVAAAMAFIGRLFGGQGTFPDALLLVVWLEFLLTLAQAVQLFALLLIPPVGVLVAFAALVMFVWLLAQFIAALHGFTNIAMVIFGMVVSFFLIITAIAILLTVFGIVPTVPKG